MVANTELQRVGIEWLAHRPGQPAAQREPRLVGLAPLVGAERAVDRRRQRLCRGYGVRPARLWSSQGIARSASGVEMLFKLGGMALAIGAIVLVQDAIIGERQLGVTEWLLSKPVSRPAYVLSKLLAHGLGVLVILVGLQGALGYGLLSLAVGEPFPLPPYPGGHGRPGGAYPLLPGVDVDDGRADCQPEHPAGRVAGPGAGRVSGRPIRQLPWARSLC